MSRLSGLPGDWVDDARRRMIPGDWVDEEYTGGKSGKTETDVALRLELPRTVGEMKERGTAFGGLEQKPRPDNFVYKRWCVFVPDPYRDENRKKDESLTKFIHDRRKQFSALLGDATLLASFVRSDGQVDKEMASHIIRALRLKRKNAPFLIIFDTSVLEIPKDFVKRWGPFTKRKSIGTVVVQFGTAGSIEEAEVVLDQLVRFMEDEDKELSHAQISLARAATRFYLASKNIAKAGVSVGKAIGSIVVAILGSTYSK